MLMLGMKKLRRSPSKWAFVFPSNAELPAVAGGDFRVVPAVWLPRIRSAANARPTRVIKSNTNFKAKSKSPPATAGGSAVKLA
jgi:hypothetical protein